MRLGYTFNISSCFVNGHFVFHNQNRPDFFHIKNPNIVKLNNQLLLQLDYILQVIFTFFIKKVLKTPQKQYNSFGTNISIFDSQYDHNF